VVAFSVAVPLLAGLLVLNRQEVFRGRVTGSVVLERGHLPSPRTLATPGDPGIPES
jgi:hypothetical protein